MVGQALGGAVLAATAALILIAAAAGFLAFLHLLRDIAADRAREKRYADEWQRTHRSNQRARYDITDVHGRPE